MSHTPLHAGKEQLSNILLHWNGLFPRSGKLRITIAKHLIGEISRLKTDDGLSQGARQYIKCRYPPNNADRVLSPDGFPTSRQQDRPPAAHLNGGQPEPPLTSSANCASEDPLFKRD
jgi:hypothetical protein